MSKFAKLNRKNPTKAEKLLWKFLRNRQLNGFKFRRQHPLNVFIPDFVCLEKKLVIEVDGEYHLDEDQRKYDELRDNWLREFHYRMVRITNEEVLNDTERALDKIRRALLEETPTNQQRHLREGEASPSPLERGPGGEVSPSPLERGSGGEVLKHASGGEVKIESTILEIAGEPDIEKGIQKAIDAKDSVGGIIECRVSGLPAGLGEPFFDSVESVISHLVFSIPAVKAIEFGTGFRAAKMFGSEHNDAFVDREGTTRTNNAGGVLAGLTNGNDLLFRIAVKPTSSTPKEQTSINLASGEMEKMTVKGRHDLCIALRVPVVLEAVTAIALVDLLMLEQRIPRRL